MMASATGNSKQKIAFIKTLRRLIFDEVMIWSDFPSGDPVFLALAFQKTLPDTVQMEDRYREWGSAFIRRLIDPAYSETFNALYQMHSKGVNIAYVVYHVFNFVYGDLDKPATLATLSEFHQCRVGSLESLNRLINHEKTLRQSLNQETLINGDDPLAQSKQLKQEKKDLLRLIKDATRAMEEIYAFELGGSQHEDADTVRSRFLDVRLFRLIPPGVKRPWLPQLATLMNTAAEIIFEKKWLAAAAEKSYSAYALRTRRRAAKPSDEIVDRIRAQHPNFAAEVLSGSHEVAMDELRRSREFKPSEISGAIIGVAKDWRRSK